MRPWPAPLLVAWLAAACTPGPMDAVRGDRWQDAQREAAESADPVAGKLVTYFRLLAPNAASAAEIAAWAAANPTWPEQGRLEQRREEALADEPDQTAALRECDRGPLRVTGAFLRCAAAYTAAGRPDDSARAVRKAWTSAVADPATEAALLGRWGAILTQDDQWSRFEFLAWANTDAAARQAVRLEPGLRAMAQARLAFRRDDPAAEAKLAAAVRTPAGDPGLMLDHAAWLRRRDRLDDARDLWLAHGTEAQNAAPPERLGAFWSERNQLARRLLRAGKDGDAYVLVGAHGPLPTEQIIDAEFLAGFIALRRLHDPAGAITHFQALATASHAALTQSRSHYWLARAEAEASRSPETEYRLAAAWPTTFYGQLAALAVDPDQTALARRIRAARDPAWTREQALDLAGTELARAATRLVAWGEPRRAHAFLLRTDDDAPAPAQRVVTARFAIALGMPDMAVAIARRMGRDGLMLPEAGWPTPWTPPPEAGLDPAIVLALMRQESSFDEGAVSPSGARGLMQLMPATAEAVSRQTGQPSTLAALTADPQLNMRLGTAYLADLARQFGSLPLALAAYNAGPNRVQEWLGTNGDPRTGGDVLDWIELIPFNETRNYVQRVLENAVIYGARAGSATPVVIAASAR